jgi:hypothetical protein
MRTLENGSIGGFQYWMPKTTATIQREAQTQLHLSSTRLLYQSELECARGGIKKVMGAACGGVKFIRSGHCSILPVRRRKHHVGQKGNSFWDILAGQGAPLGSTRRTLAVIIVLAGVLTFFVPLVSTHPPVVQRTRWSPFAIVRQMYLGSLPQPICERCGEPVIRSLLALPVYISMVYLLLIFALVRLGFRNATASIANTSLIGIWFSLSTYMFRGGTNFRTEVEFERTFYGYSRSLGPSDNGPVFYGWLTLVLLAALTALLFIATHEDLDAETASDELPTSSAGI